MQNLCVASEAHTLIAMCMVSLFNDATRHESYGGFSEEVGDTFRISVAVSKYHITKRLPKFVYECMEVSFRNFILSNFIFVTSIWKDPVM